eukprot:TRINITY_DN1733_c0_g1_i1.p5 TRINITY_DN1733_c0_g1~~TRINITY_DN1733_c0_g1_i1.p5  ORF type:complete len:113 (-),score=31.08 TRINITY_DN1733_c0_g1_i1:418-756(-)
MASQSQGVPAGPNEATPLNPSSGQMVDPSAPKAHDNEPRGGKILEKCHKCGNVLEVHYETGAGTWVCCAGIFLVGGVFGCCLIPFFMDGCKDAYFKCYTCNEPLPPKKFIFN